MDVRRGCQIGARLASSEWIGEQQPDPQVPQPLGVRRRLGVSLVTQPPGIATPLHRHTREAEAFLVLEGRVSYRAGEETYELDDGCFIWLPQSVPHAFRIRGTSPARFVAFTAPGGLMGLYDEVGIPAQERRLPGEDGQPPEVEIPKWAEVGPRYGLEVVGPGIPE